jgi:surface antigen
MKLATGLAAATLALCCASVALGASGDDFSVEGDRADEAAFLQCVPYARQVSGIRIFGDAHTWWDRAAGRYARGNRPRPGAVMSFRPYGNMRLGHVAAVSRVIDSRTVLLRHANWSLIGGRRGQIEDDVRAVDVSEANDWSEVRVWFAPIQGLGTTHWPINGFIYPDKGAGRLEAPRMVLASADARPERKSRIGNDFLKGIALDDKPRKAVTTARPGKRASDPIGEIIALVS